MTPQELDTALRELSDHEKLYQQGSHLAQVRPPQHRDQASGIPRSMASGRFTWGAAWYDLKTKEPLADFVPYPNLPLNILRHSRFREWPLHQQEDFVEIAYMYDGSAREEVNGAEFTLERGQVLIVDADAAHTTHPLGESDILVVIEVDKSFFDARFLAMLNSHNVLTTFFVRSITKGAAHDGYIVFHSENSRRLPLFMAELLCEWFEPSECHSEMLSSLFGLVITELSCIHERDVVAQGNTSRSITLEVLHYIEQNYRTCSLKEAAERFGMNPDSLSRQLKRETGSTFNQLVQQQRVSVAKVYLANADLPVTAVARQVGYENVTFFYEVFERVTGTTPGDYRKSQGFDQQLFESEAPGA